MSHPDTIQAVVNSIASMSEMEYVYLLFKLLGILGAALAAGGSFLALLYKGAVFLWGRILTTLQRDLGSTFSSVQNLEKIAASLARLESAVTNGFADVSARLQNGDERMNQLDQRLNNLVCQDRGGECHGGES